jgi:ferredoxin
MAMEGNGPRTGKPRKMGVLILSSDPVALDSIACKLINLNPEYVPTSKPGEKSGLGTYHYENIEVVGDDLGPFIVKDFRVVRKPSAPVTGNLIRTILKNRITPRPVIDLKKCTGCGTCIKMCPVGRTALDWARYEAGKKPRHIYDKCIRCYCCQETCPEGVITIMTPLLGKLLFRS